MFVYVIQAQESGRIKIGISANPAKRLSQVQNGNPEHLRLVGAVPGGRRLESQLHSELAQYRLCGEWFEPSDGVVCAVGRLLGWDRALIPTEQQVESQRKADEVRELLSGAVG